MQTMLRPEYLLHPQRTPAPALPAATLVLLRPHPATGWEVLLTRRSARASFAADMYVFPGGAIEPEDAQWPAPLVRFRPEMDATMRAAAVAALRETFEEMGVLLACDAQGQQVAQSVVDQLERHAPLWPQLQAHGLQLDAAALWQVGHFTAPAHLPKRFAVPFFVAAMPAQQTAQPDNSEQFEAVWVQPQAALAAHKAQRMPMMLPTVRALMYLAPYADLPAIQQAASGGMLWQHAPRFARDNGKERSLLESDSAYGEVQLVSPDGQVVHDVGWQSTQAVALCRHVWRLTAPNAGVMTGPGTNSYLIGEAATGFVVMDPGPADAAHVQRLLQAAGGDVRHIVCTHSHPDHAPGAWLLQQLCADQGRPRPAVYGMPSGASARADSVFVPDVALHDGAQLVLHGPQVPGAAAPPVTHTLRAIHTPGHAANHLCFLLQEDALLFTGDHVLNGSTTIVDVPDGNMRDYIDSLDTLAQLCQDAGVEFLLPAHGHVLAQAPAVIARLKAHRLAREAKVLAALQQQPQGTLQDWVALAYADTPQALWPLAERSLIAHVERIRALGLAHVPER